MPCLSKVLEDFVVSWLIEDVRDTIDPMQFGCLKGTSTSYCLLDMVHNWLLQLDSPTGDLRVCFLDFWKALTVKVFGEGHVTYFWNVEVRGWYLVVREL